MDLSMGALGGEPKISDDIFNDRFDSERAIAEYFSTSQCTRAIDH